MTKGVEKCRKRELKEVERSKCKMLGVMTLFEGMSTMKKLSMARNLLISAIY